MVEVEVFPGQETERGTPTVRRLARSREASPTHRDDVEGNQAVYEPDPEVTPVRPIPTR